MAGSFRAELVKKSPGPIELYEVALDTARVQDVQDEEPFVEYIRALRSGRKVDLIVPVGAPAALFLQRYRTILFHNVPMLVIGADLRRIPGATLSDNDAAVLLDLDLPAYLENILRLRPETTDVAVVVGNSPVERFWTSELRRDFEPFGDRVHLTWFNDLTFDEMLARAASMPPRSAILYFLLSEDAAGVTYSQDRALEKLREVANVPVFGMGDYELGRGIVGGPLMQTQALGQEGAEVALRILKGEKPGSINAPSIVFGAPIYDWRELRRWGISEARLPPGSVVQYQQPTIWQQYHKEVLAAIGAFAGQTLVVVILLIQMRKRQQAELSLKESDDRMAFAAASTGTGIWQLDIVADRLWTTEYCRSMLGLANDATPTMAALIGAFHPDDRAALGESVRSAIDRGMPIDGEFRVVAADGATRWFATRGRPRCDENGRPIRLSGIFADVTARRNAEAEAEFQRKELTHLLRVSVLGELSGAIAHELNQPLTAILANAQAARLMIGEKNPDLGAVSEVLDDIMQEDNRAGEVIQRLRTLLKKGERKAALVDISDLVDSTLRLLHGELVARKIHVDVALPDRLPPTWGDAVQLQQVLLNLVMNAMDSMNASVPSARLITISARAGSDGSVTIDIADRGRGIDGAAARRLFQPFFTTKEHGLGLGLSICSTIVKAHGGTLSLRNNAERGATATLMLPAEAAMLAAE